MVGSKLKLLKINEVAILIIIQQEGERASKFQCNWKTKNSMVLAGAMNILVAGDEVEKGMLERMADKETGQRSDPEVFANGKVLSGSVGNLMALLVTQFASHFVGFALRHSQLVYDLIHRLRSLPFQFHLKNIAFWLSDRLSNQNAPLLYVHNSIVKKIIKNSIVNN